MNHRLVFTANNRPYYFGPVLDSWSRVRGFHDWSPTAYIEPGPAQRAMSTLALRHRVDPVLHHSHLGVLSNPWHALDAAFTQHNAEFVVLAEDDVLVSDDILEFFTYTAQTYWAEHVLAICAASFEPAAARGDVRCLRRSHQFCPLIWGTWRDRWLMVLRDTWDHDYSSGTPDAPQSGWDWNINLRVMDDWEIISPIVSRSTHIGEYQGTHTTAESYPGSVAPTFQAHRPTTPFVEMSNR